jgi:hypothetical protein
MSRLPRIPKLCHHKATGQAYVTLDGRERYLGVHGTAEAQGAYDRLLSEWMANGRTIATARAVDGAGAGAGFTVTELCVAFWEHAQTHYRTPEGSRTGELAPMKHAIRKLRKNYGDTPVPAGGLGSYSCPIGKPAGRVATVAVAGRVAGAVAGELWAFTSISLRVVFSFRSVAFRFSSSVIRSFA